MLATLYLLGFISGIVFTAVLAGGYEYSEEKE